MTFDWAAELEREGGALGDAAAVDLAAAVPAAPGWDTTELLRHVGLLYVRSSVILQTGTMERPSRKNGMLPEPPGDGVLEWYRASLADLLVDVRGDRRPGPAGVLLRVSPPAGRVLAPPHGARDDDPPGRRRAGGGPDVTPIAPVFGADGIDEIFTVFVPAFGADRSPGDGRSVHLHATDADSEWLIRFEPGGIVAEPGHAKGDAAVRGPAAELLLWLWGRRPLDGLDLIGDRPAAEALRRVTTF